MAKEYIDRNLAAEFLYRSINADPEGKCENCHITRRDCEYEQIFTRMDICGRIDDVIAEIPAADVMPVVRCRECAYHDTADYGDGYTKNVCRLLNRQIQDDDYCSYAWRKDGDGE